MTLQKYDFSVQNYNSSQYLPTDCIDWNVQNNGDGIILINNFPIAPGQSFGLAGNAGEIMEANIFLQFTTGTIFSATYTRRFYL